MVRRALIAVALLVVALENHAQRWHSVAAPLYRGLPEVSIDLGYPRGYIPADNAPIDLTARTADTAFDGTIGFRFAVEKKFTRESAVVARANIAPHASWSFHTVAQIAYLNEAHKRELVIEWRDRNGQVLARRNVGVPPWARRKQPLRIGGSAPQRYLDMDAVVLQPSELGSDAQWYAGFATIVTPVDVWLDLPIATRETIFNSAITLHFFGTPRAGQQLAEVDELLLPVRFAPGAGDVAVPSLLRNGKPATQRVPMSWRAVDGAEIIGASERPYIVDTPAATFTVDEEALRQPLPVVKAIMHPLPARIFRDPNLARATAHYVEDTPTLPLALAALVAAPFLWIRLKKSSDLRVVSIALLLAAAILAARSSFRRMEDVVIAERWQTVQPGVVSHRWYEESYGRAPLRASAIAAADRRTLIARRLDAAEDVEVRREETPPGHGMLMTSRPWHTTERSRMRRERSDGTTVNILSMSKTQLVMDYRTAISPRAIYATWTLDGSKYGGMASVRAASGHVTIEAGTLESPSYWYWFDSPDEANVLPPQGESIRVVFFDNHERSRERVAGWTGTKGIRNSFVPYTLTAGRRQLTNQMAILTYRLPSVPWPADGRISVWPALGPNVDGAIEVIGERGTIALKTSTIHFQEGRQISEAPLAELRKIAGPAEVIQVRFKTKEPLDAGDEIAVRLGIVRNLS